MQLSNPHRSNGNCIAIIEIPSGDGKMDDATKIIERFPKVMDESFAEFKAKKARKEKKRQHGGI